MAEQIKEFEGWVVTEEKQKVEQPPMYLVLLHNDDYTTMDFVVAILEHVFGRSPEEAARIMLNVHNNGVGVAGVYTREIAETKVITVHELARRNEFPLQCSMEKE
ncbi:MAG: ATP-dependent Clp protease adapter ClpS [Fibrobacterota bacterium]